MALRLAVRTGAGTVRKVSQTDVLSVGLHGLQGVDADVAARVLGRLEERRKHQRVQREKVLVKVFCGMRGRSTTRGRSAA